MPEVDSSAERDVKRKVEEEEGEGEGDEEEIRSKKQRISDKVIEVSDEKTESPSLAVPHTSIKDTRMNNHRIILDLCEKNTLIGYPKTCPNIPERSHGWFYKANQDVLETILNKNHSKNTFL